MAALSKVGLATACRIAAVNRSDRMLIRRIPRRCTLVAVGLILIALGIPLLMAAQVLPTTLWLGFVALVLLAVGGGRLLVGWGEI